MRKRRDAGSRRPADRSDLSPLLYGLILAAILVGAALLRFYRLDAQSFWNDEGNSARIAERSLDLIIEGAAGDIHPPGYYLLLHGWRALFGQSEFALRSLSVLAGVAMVLFTGLLASRLFGRRVGLVAASLSAASPFAVYYSQEARMYALLGALSAASTYLAFGAFRAVEGASRHGDRRRALPVGTLVSYGLVSAAGLYTHYAFVFILVAHNLAFGLRWLARGAGSDWQWRGPILWVGAQLGALLLYLPWLPTALNAAGWSSAPGDYRLGPAMLDVARILVVGRTQPLAEAGIAVAVGVGLLVAGLGPRSRGAVGKGAARSPGLDVASMVIYLAVPLALFFLLDLYKPAWLKFLIVLQPAFHVLVARGVDTVGELVVRASERLLDRRRVVRSLVSAVFVIALLAMVYSSLRNLYFDPAYARDDYRQLAADLRERRRPGDAIVLNAPNQWEVLTYYYPDRDVFPAPYRPRPGKVPSFLGALLDDYERLFVVYWGDAESDPRRRIESWLAEHAYKAGDRWYGDVRLATYGAAALPETPDVDPEIVVGDRIVLRGYAVVGGAFAPGEIVPVTLFWEALRSLESPYKVTVQMLDGQGRLVSQVDTIPGDGLAPTTAWQPGDRLADRYGVLVPDDAASGTYTLIAAVYHAATGQRLAVEGAAARADDVVRLGEIVVARGD
jgi:4-amino-4-deoxy-L-arabinose transferase-like glycosyltransferase